MYASWHGYLAPCTLHPGGYTKGTKCIKMLCKFIMFRACGASIARDTQRSIFFSSFFATRNGACRRCARRSSPGKVPMDDLTPEKEEAVRSPLKAEPGAVKAEPGTVRAKDTNE